MRFKTLTGFREFYPEECSQRNHLFSVWKRVSKTFAFSEYDAPVLESLDLYVEKSGEEIVGQLFNFEDRGGRAVALRPEMTPSLARLIGARANALKRPVKWFNIGEQYRYERPQKGRLRAFYQFNADIFGIEGPEADAELVALLVAALSSLGLGAADFRVRLSDRLLWALLLEAAGLQGESGAAVLGVVDKLGRVPREKSIEQLQPHLPDAEGWLSEIETMMTTVTSVNALEKCFGDLKAQLDAAGCERVDARLEAWRVLLQELEALGCAEFIQIDLSIVRGLAYYTGFVFEAFETTGDARALAGGGRYDDLVQKLGGPAMPAVGFAMGDVTVMDLLESKGLVPTYVDRPDFAVAIAPGIDRAVGVSLGASLRAAGYSVELPLREQSMNKQLKALGQKGVPFVAVFEAAEGEGEAGGLRVSLRDLNARTHRESSESKIFSDALEALTVGSLESEAAE